MDFAGDLPRQYIDGIAMARASQRVQSRMNLQHEGREMDPSPLRLGRGVEEQVHQHGLAAPDRSPEIKPAWRRGLIGEQAAQQTALLGACAEGCPQTIQRFGGTLLRHVGGQRAGGDSFVIGGERAVGSAHSVCTATIDLNFLSESRFVGKFTQIAPPRFDRALFQVSIRYRNVDCNKRLRQRDTKQTRAC